MKLIFIIYIFLSVALLASEIEVVDKETGRPLPSATISWKSEGDTVYQNKLTNKLGKVVIPNKGKLELRAKFIGYEPKVITINNNEKVKLELEQKSIYLGEIVTTGQIMPKSSQESVYSIGVINQEHLESRGAVNLRDVMMTEMGINLTQDNILGSSMSINGVTGRNVKILVDGVPMIGRVNGNIDLSQINLNNAERIEIIKGPMSTMYGTDALGGVINIITKENLQNDLSFNANSYYESVGQYNLDFTLGGNYNNYMFDINAGRNFFGGYSPLDTSRFKQWKPREQYFVNAQLKKTLSNVSMRYTGSAFTELILNRGNPRPPFGENALDDKYSTDRFNNSIFVDAKFNDKMFLESFVNHSYFNRRKNTFLLNRVTMEEIKVPDPSYHNTEIFSAFQSRVTFNHDDPLKYISYKLGFDLIHEYGTGQRIASGDQQMGDYAMFLITQFKPMDNLNIQPSVRLIENTIYDAPIIPALNMKYDFTKISSVRLSYSRGFRAPSIKELYFNFFDINHRIQGNENLKAETSHNYNASFSFNFEEEKYVLSIEPSVFYNDIEDLITLANINGDLWENVNIGNYKTLGGSIDLNYFRNSLSSRFGFTYIGIYNELAGDFGVEEFLYSPEFQANIMYDFKSINSRVSLFYKFTGRRLGYELIDDEVNQFEISNFNTLDLTMNTSFFEKRISLNFGAKNLFNVTDIRNSAQLGGGAHSSADGLNAVAWGRTFFTQIQIKAF